VLSVSAEVRSSPAQDPAYRPTHRCLTGSTASSSADICATGASSASRRRPDQSRMPDHEVDYARASPRIPAAHIRNRAEPRGDCHGPSDVLAGRPRPPTRAYTAAKDRSPVQSPPAYGPSHVCLRGSGGSAADLLQHHGLNRIACAATGRLSRMSTSTRPWPPCSVRRRSAAANDANQRVMWSQARRHTRGYSKRRRKFEMYFDQQSSRRCHTSVSGACRDGRCHLWSISPATAASSPLTSMRTAAQKTKPPNRLLVSPETPLAAHNKQTTSTAAALR
jgi:hypothetical protein